VIPGANRDAEPTRRGVAAKLESPFDLERPDVGELPPAGSGLVMELHGETEAGEVTAVPVHEVT
jgi:hypothetical protein